LVNIRDILQKHCTNSNCCNIRSGRKTTRDKQIY